MRADNDGEGGILALLALVRERGRRNAARGVAARPPRAVRRRAALRRRRHHARDLGALARSRASRSLRRPLRRLVPAAVVILIGPVPGAAERHRQRGRRVRADHPGLVLQHRRAGAVAIAGHPEVLRAINPLHAVAFFATQRLRRVSGARLRGPRASPAARRCTPTWATSAGGRSPSPGTGWCCRRWCSSTSGRARCCSRTRRRREPVLPACRRMGALSARRARDRRHGDRVAGAHLRRVLAHASGGAARLLPRIEISTHVRAQIGQIYVPAVNWALMLACIGAGARVPRARRAWPRPTASRSPPPWRSPRCCSTSSPALRMGGRWILAGCALLGLPPSSTSRSLAPPLQAPDRRLVPDGRGACGLQADDHLAHRASPRARTAATWRSAGLCRDSSRTFRRIPRCVGPVPGVYLFATTGVTPPALLANLRHNDALHEASARPVGAHREATTRFRHSERAEYHLPGRWLPPGRVALRIHGRTRRSPCACRSCRTRNSAPISPPSATSWDESLCGSRRAPRAWRTWREHLFALMDRNATDPAFFFRLPAHQVFELGIIVEL